MPLSDFGFDSTGGLGLDFGCGSGAGLAFLAGVGVGVAFSGISKIGAGSGCVVSISVTTVSKRRSVWDMAVGV